jgi:hypothetical protein
MRAVGRGADSLTSMSKPCTVILDLETIFDWQSQRRSFLMLL